MKEGKPVMWTSDHVFAALQLRSAGQGSKEETDGFIVIRYGLCPFDIKSLNDQETPSCAADPF